MGMICQLLALSPEQISILRSAPSGIGGLVSSLYLERLQASQADTSDLRIKLAAAGQLQPMLSLEKAWHMLHYLLAGDSMPTGGPGDMLLSGEEIGEEFSGYGPARLIDVSDVRAFAGFIHGLDAERLTAGLNSREMAERGVYGIPFGGDLAREEVLLREEAATFFLRLRSYVTEAEKRGDGLLIWLT